MKAASRGDPPLAVVSIVVVAVFLGKLWWSDTAFYESTATTRALIATGALVKLASLALGAVFSARLTGLFEGASRLGWRLGTFWFTTWTVGQGILVWHQLVLEEAAPFPSPADAFFVAGYPAMIAAFFTFVWTWVATGLVGTTRSHVVVGTAVSVPFVGLAVVVLRPVIAAEGTPLATAINIAYPAFDIIALAPTVVLLRIAARLAGGALFWVWALTSTGIVFLVAGDLLYGWFSLLQFTALDPLLDVFFLLGYAFLARGAFQQLRISSVPPEPRKDQGA
jgi:hypothetical protein